MENDQSNMNNVPPAEDKKKTLSKKHMLVVLTAIVVVVAGTLFLLADKGLTKSDLVSESSGGVMFKRPKQWQKASVTDADIEIAYTEDGMATDDSDQALAIGVNSLGANYNDLSDDQKKLVSDSFDNQFSDPTSLESGDCEEIGEVITKEVKQGNYDTVFRVEAICEKLTDKQDAKAKIKMFIGVKDDSIHLVAITALEELWDKNSKAFDEILDTIQPAN